MYVCERSWLKTCAGATGLVGSRLAAKLAAQGNRVRVLTRDINSARGKLQYPGLEFYSLAQIAQAVQGSDAIVNLAGAPIGTRYVALPCPVGLLDQQRQLCCTHYSQA